MSWGPLSCCQPHPEIESQKKFHEHERWWRRGSQGTFITREHSLHSSRGFWLVCRYRRWRRCDRPTFQTSFPKTSHFASFSLSIEAREAPEKKHCRYMVSSQKLHRSERRWSIMELAELHRDWRSLMRQLFHMVNPTWGCAYPRTFLFQYHILRCKHTGCVVCAYIYTITYYLWIPTAF